MPRDEPSLPDYRMPKNILSALICSRCHCALKSVRPCRHEDQWGRMLKWYARSLSARDYDILEHPSFHDFVCGMMTDIEGFPEFEELRDRFPPRALPGLDPKVS